MPYSDVTNASLKRVFSYGTLMGASENSHIATIKGDLHHNYRYPMLVEGDNTVWGEIQDYSNYSDDEWLDVLGTLDAYEGVQHKLYVRLPGHVEDLVEDTSVLCWMYVFVDYKTAKTLPHLPSGDWGLWKSSNDKSTSP